MARRPGFLSDIVNSDGSIGDAARRPCLSWRHCHRIDDSLIHGKANPIVRTLDGDEKPA